MEDKLWSRIEDARTAVDLGLWSVPLDLNALIPVPRKVVRDLSLSGARLVFASQQLLPHTFELHTTDSPVRRCALCWAKDRMAGVRFLTDSE